MDNEPLPVPVINDVARVRGVVRDHVERDAIVDLPRAAKYMGMSARTLQRVLAAAGTSFRGLVQDVRRDMALELLAEGQLTVERVSLAVGYSDPKALRRAFHRWGEDAPSRCRTRLALASPKRIAAPPRELRP